MPAVDIFDEILRLRRSGRKAVLATIVHTQGSIPSYQSSKMVVREDGSIAGTVGGGCVEGDVWSAAKQVLQDGRPRKLAFNLNADPRYDAGLTCGGTLEVYLEPIAPGTNTSVFEEAVRLRNEHKKSVLATVIQAPAPAHARPNDRVLIAEDGSFLGSFQDERLDAEVRAAAREVLRQERSRKLSLTGAAGEPVEIALEPVLPQPSCVLLGAGHVAQHVSRIAAQAGFAVVVADDRDRFANRERFPEAADIYAGEWTELFRSLKPGNSSYLVIVTRGHKEDMTVLRWAVGTDARYIGLIGSRRKVLSIYKVLEEEGIPREALERVHAPIGVDIGALTPEEIAVSIVAELIAVRRNAALPEAKTLGTEPQAGVVTAKPSR